MIIRLTRMVCKRAQAHLLLACLIASCGPIVELPGGGEPAALYELIPTAPSSSATARDITLLLEAPSLPTSLRSDQIAVRPSAREIRYLSDVRWGERAATMIYRYLRKTFDSSDRIQVIGNDTLEVPGGFRLRIEFYDFSFHTDELASRGDVQIQANALLLRNGPAQVLASRRFSSEQGVSVSPGVESIVAAFNEALDRVAFELLDWTESEIAAAGN